MMGDGLGIRSEIKNDNVILTESIELRGAKE
jgi:hypothetical protein